MENKTKHRRKQSIDHGRDHALQTGHGGDENRGRKERKKEVPGGGHNLDHDRDGGVQPWSRRDG